MQVQTKPPETAKMGSAQEPLLPPPGAPGTPAAYPDQGGSAVPPTAKHFDTGICECCTGPDGCVICLVSDCLPCVGHALVADAASQHTSGKLMPLLLYTLGNSFFPCATAIVLGTLARGKLRQTYGMESNTCGGARLAVFLWPRDAKLRSPVEASGLCLIAVLRSVRAALHVFSAVRKWLGRACVCSHPDARSACRSAAHCHTFSTCLTQQACVQTCARTFAATAARKRRSCARCGRLKAA